MVKNLPTPKPRDLRIVEPGWWHAGAISGHKKHATLAFTPSTRAAFDAELVGFETGKGTVALPYDAQPPLELIRRMIEHRVREYEIDGINWF